MPEALGRLTRQSHRGIYGGSEHGNEIPARCTLCMDFLGVTCYDGLRPGHAVLAAPRDIDFGLF